MNEKYYLGLFNGHADPAVALVKNGEVIAYAEEERFNRVKHAMGMYPFAAMKYCLDVATITLSQVESVSLCRDLDKAEDLQHFFESLNATYQVDEGTKAWQRNLLPGYNPANATKKHHFEWRRIFGDVPFPPVTFNAHHLTHAFQAAMQSPFEESVCITLDGSGDQYCTTVWEHRGTSLTPIHQVTMPHSLGWFYAAFTEYLGFQAYDGEYKLMGLAAYGRHNQELIDKIAKVIAPDPKQPFSYIIDPSYIHYGKHSYSNRFTDKLVELMGEKPKIATDSFSSWHEDVAFGVQYHLEQAVERLITWAVKKTGIHNVTVGGGVGLNVKMNSAIFELPEVADVWANPLCSDGGSPVGAALLTEFHTTKKRPAPLRSLNLGYEESNENIEQALKRAKVPFRKSSNIAQEVAKALSEGKVVAWFQGRMEGGPRALGQRSILADPRTVASRDRVNAVIKFREYWRPFCPSMLREAADRYFDHYTEAPFMVIAFKANERLQQEAPAIVHVDGTSRVQFVEKDVLPKYHAMISEFERLTGVPVVLNTSFNVKGEPVVCTIKDALRTFWATGLDVLAAGDYIIDKGSLQ